MTQVAQAFGFTKVGVFSNDGNTQLFSSRNGDMGEAQALGQPNLHTLLGWPRGPSVASTPGICKVKVPDHRVIPKELGVFHCN